MDNDNLYWLISCENLKIITNDYKYDWVLEIFNNNGLTSIEDAFYKFYNTRFQYSNPDCPHCGIVANHYVLNSDFWQCRNNKCRYQFSITSCTYMNHTKIDYYKWFRVAYLIGNIGLINSAAIARDINVTQDTAWHMIDTLRNARKKTYDNKFVNGSEVLKFNSFWNIIELLVTIVDKPEINFQVNKTIKHFN